jgi:hypothetical protein
MRILTAAVVMLAMLGSAHAQFNMGPGSGKRQATPEQERQSKDRNKADDKAYKSALDKIQTNDQNQKPDPWKNMR